MVGQIVDECHTGTENSWPGPDSQCTCHALNGSWGLGAFIANGSVAKVQ